MPGARRLRWPVWLAAIGTGAASVLLVSTTYFSAFEYLFTVITMAIVALALRRRPVGATSQILYFQVLLLTVLYPVKGMKIAWDLETNAYDLLPSPLRNGVEPSEFSLAYVTSSVTITLVAICLILLPRHTYSRMGHGTRFDTNALTVVTVAFFIVSMMLRLASIEGLPGSVVYVLNHRGAHFAFALLVYVLVSQGRFRIAQNVFFGWLALGVVQFLLFTSKSYIFLPVVGLFALFLFSGVLLIRGWVAMLGCAIVIAGYPILNLYRSILLGTYSEFGSMVSAVALYKERLDGIAVWEMVPIYANDVIDRFVGIEWYLKIIEAYGGHYLPDAGGPIENMSLINETMRSIMGLRGEAIGIAPSLLGSAFLILRDPYLTPILAAGFCLLFVVLHRGLVLAFPRVRDAIALPLSLIIFSIVTDGLVTSLYWDIPALILTCALFSTFASPARLQ